MADLVLTSTRRALLGGIAAGATCLAVSAAPAFAVDVPKPERQVDMTEVLKPGPLKEMVMGDEKAPVTIVEYLSMTCPHCARFETDVLPSIKTKYIDSGKVRFITREFPFDPAATAVFMLARCVPNGETMPFIEMMFKQQRAWAAPSDGDVKGALLQQSKLAGFTQESFNACLTNQELAGQVTSVRDRAAKEFGVNATPTFFINGGVYAGEMSVDEMSALIDSML